MSRLYKYAISNDKTGYYIIGDNGNATFQCEPIVERLFDTLDYNPPIKTEGQGPQIPTTLHWNLFDLEWIYTGEHVATPITPDELSDKIESGRSLTDEMVAQIKEFADQIGNKEAQELAERFDFADEVKESQKLRLSDMGTADFAIIETCLFEYLSAALPDASGEPVELLKVSMGHIEETSETVLNVSICLEGNEPNFIHILTVTSNNGITGVWSRTDGHQTLEAQSQIDIHRGHIFAGLNQINKNSIPKIKFDQQDLKGHFEHSASFEADFPYPDGVHEV